MGNRDNILEKIRKCMALANSANEHEAAAALRQARKLMEMYQVSHAEMLAAGVKEASAKAGVLTKPSNWENYLAGYIAEVFGCKLIFRSGWHASHWAFIGLPPANDVAAYSFEVLYRQAKKARQEFMGLHLKRFKKTNKVRRADLFSLGWVQSACCAVSPLTPIDGAAEAIAAYVELKFSNLGKLDTVDRNKGRSLSEKDEMALIHGRQSGRSAQLNKGVGAGAAPLMLEG
jgi:hypothetical protein